MKEGDNPRFHKDITEWIASELGKCHRLNISEQNPESHF